MQQLLEHLPKKVIAPPAPTSQSDSLINHNSIITQDFQYIKVYAKSKGVDVMKISSGYRVHKWGLFKDVRTLSELETFFGLLGVE
jgi:hypothetical protein